MTSLERRILDLVGSRPVSIQMIYNGIFVDRDTFDERSYRRIKQSIVRLANIGKLVREWGNRRRSATGWICLYRLP